MTTTESGSEFPCILSFTPLSSRADEKPDLAAGPDSPVSGEFCRAFEDLTGWTLGFKESKPSQRRRRQAGLADSPATGKFFIDDMSASLPPDAPACHRAKCDRFVETIDELVNELQQTKLQLYATHAELATQIPFATSADRSVEAESYRLAELLAALLNSAAQSVGCEQAAMYLLDDNAEWLTMRASVGLRGKHILNDQRLLATSVADIEAMAGHAIVVTDPTQGKTWNAPEPCHSAVCVPISSTTTILGTLWIFGGKSRDYSDHEVNILEIIAGRIAAELERESFAKLNSEPKRTAPSCSTRIECHPVIDPPFAGWKLEGECGQVDQKFVNWDVTDNEEIRLTIGTLGANNDRNSASIFVDPLTTNFQAHGSVEGVSFWLLDQETGVVFDIDEWANPLPLGKNHSIVATTTADRKQAKQILKDFNEGNSVGGLFLRLSRV